MLTIERIFCTIFTNLQYNHEHNKDNNICINICNSKSENFDKSNLHKDFIGCFIN